MFMLLEVIIQLPRLFPEIFAITSAKATAEDTGEPVGDIIFILAIFTLGDVLEAS